MQHYRPDYSLSFDLCIRHQQLPAVTALVQQCPDTQFILVLEVFREGRVTFGGDWPVILHASSYRRWVETLQAFTAILTEAAKKKIWYENAQHIYRLVEDV